MTRSTLVMRTLAACLTLALLPVGPAIAAKGGGGAGFTSYLKGSAIDVGTAPLAGGLLLAGGGTDSDDAMRWLLRRNGPSDVVVLDAYGTDTYGQYLLDLGADSVQTFVFSSSAGANSTVVVDAVRRAEVIWIDGGDQSNYVAYWQGTALQAAVNARVAEGAAFGGTSAGLAVLGDWVYSALGGSATSARVLANPYDKDVTLRGRLFDVPVLANTITDSHVKVRDRMGRLVGFLARLEKDLGATAPKGIAVDEASAVAVDPLTGSAQLFGSGAGAWFLSTGDVGSRLVMARKPLTYAPVTVQRMTSGDTFNLRTWEGVATDTYTVSAVGGVLTWTSPGTPY